MKFMKSLWDFIRCAPYRVQKVKGAQKRLKVERFEGKRPVDVFRK